MGTGVNVLHSAVDCVWNVMAHAQKPDFVFWQNGQVHLNRQGRQFSRLLAAEVCATVVVMLDTPCSEVVWRILATHSICHFPSRTSPCAITFQLDSKDFFMTFLNFRFMLMSVFNSTIQSVPCTSNNKQQARQCRHLNHDDSDSIGFGGCRVASCYAVHLAVRLQEETLQKETSHNWYKNQTLDAHSLEDDDISAQSDSDTGDSKDINPHSGLALKTVELLYLSSTSYRGVPVGYDKKRHPTLIKTLPNSAFPCSSFLKLYNSWWNRQIDTSTSTWTHWTKEGPHSLTWVFRECVCFWQLLAYGARSNRHAERLLVDTRTILHSLLCQHYETRQSI